MKSIRFCKIVPVLLLFSLLALAGCSQQDAGQAKAGEQEKKGVAVQTTSAVHRDLETALTYPCQIRPAKQVAVTSKLAGKVNAVFFDVSDHVHTGDPLFTLDSVDIMNNIKTLQAQIDTAEAGIRSAQTGVYLSTGSQLQSQILQASGGVQQAKTAWDQAKIGLSNAEQTLEQAQLALKDLEKDYQSSKMLLDIGELTKRQMEQLELGLEQSGIRVAQAELALDQARVVLAQTEASHVQALSSYNLVYNDVPAESLQRAEDALHQVMTQRDALLVQLENAQSTLSDTTVRSPFTGVISTRAVEVGQMIAQSAVPFVIMQTDSVYATVNVSENLIASLRTGQEIPVKISSVQSEPFIGRIEVISPAAAQGAAAFEVRIALENGDGLIKPGMYAEVHIVKERQEKALAVPRSAILEDTNGRYVYVVEDSVAQKRSVVTGIDSQNEIAILSGLNSTDQVVIKGQKSLIEGALVNIVDPLGE